jgi:hypothetical protein
MDDDDHTVTIIPKSQITDSSFCRLPDSQFRLLYRLEELPKSYLLNSSNPGQFYFNSFYNGMPGSDFTMNIQIPYPFVTQEGAGVPIQIHDGTSLDSGGCYNPAPKLDGYAISTEAMSPTSSSGNQIITFDDYSSETLGSSTTITVGGTVPASGLAHVTIHLDYSLKKTSGWQPTGSTTTNPMDGALLPDASNGTVTIHGYETYSFTRAVGGDTATVLASSRNEFKKFTGVLGFVTDTDNGPIVGATVELRDTSGELIETTQTDDDGYYIFYYRHKGKASSCIVTLVGYAADSSTGIPVISTATGAEQEVTLKANGLAIVDFERAYLP